MELLDRILWCHSDKPDALRIAIGFHRTFLIKQLIPLVPKCSIDSASKRGLISLLNYWKTHFTNDNNDHSNTHKTHYSVQAIDRASEAGHISILDWWLNESGWELRYTENAIDHCTDIPTLEWWISHSIQFCGSLQLKYSKKALDRLSEYGHIKVLNFWIHSGLTLLWSDQAINMAASNNQISVLNWWKNSGLEFIYNEWAMDRASKNGHMNVLNWFKNSGFEPKYSYRAMDYASEKSL